MCIRDRPQPPDSAKPHGRVGRPTEPSSRRRPGPEGPVAQPGDLEPGYRPYLASTHTQTHNACSFVKTL
eukprot:13474816-Alexandrium_andersonii.AAC.1